MKHNELKKNRRKLISKNTARVVCNDTREKNHAGTVKPAAKKLRTHSLLLHYLDMNVGKQGDQRMNPLLRMQ